MAKGEERGVVIAHPSEASLALEGLYADPGGGRGGAVIAPPHPRFGGSMDSPVVTELAHACSAAGLASLRFNWRGVGGSGGAASGDADDAHADYAAALDELAATTPGPLLAAGYSFGAAAAVQAAQGAARVEGLLLVSPPPSLLDAEALARFAGPVLLLVGERDELAPPAALAELAAGLPAGRCVPLPDADHFFRTGLAALGAEARAWLGGGEA